MVRGHKKRDKCNLTGGKLSKLTITCPRGGPCSEPSQYKQAMSCKACPKMRGISW
jgi:hypothetical protein